MRKFILLILVALTASTVAMAQIAGGDELGAHNGYGRGCVESAGLVDCYRCPIRLHYRT